jgi:hypothetical protein
MNPGVNRIKRILTGLLVAGVVALLLGFLFAKRLVYVESGSPRGDVIVVLGGPS